MQALKIILCLILSVVLLLSLIVFVLIKNLDPLIELAIETVGPEVTKTNVQVEQVKTRLRDGRGDIYGLAIGNPEGYRNDWLLEVGQISLSIDADTLRDDVIVIREILIDGALVAAEHKGITDVNLKDLLASMRSSAAAPKTDVPTTAAPNLRFMVERFNFIGGRMTLSSPHFTTQEYRLADIRLRGLGSRKDGLTPEQLARAILEPITSEAQKRAEKELKSQVEGRVLDRLQDRLSEKDRKHVESLRVLLGR